MDNTYDENGRLTPSFQRSPRPQFNYFYGSTAVTSPPASVNTDEQDSLVGEQLINTDNECDIPTNGDDDDAYQQDFIIDDQRYRTQAKDRRTVFPCKSILILLFVSGLVSIALVVLFPPQQINDTPQRQTFDVPFTAVDRAEFGDPVEGFVNMDLFSPRLIRHDDIVGPPGSDGGNDASRSSASFALPFPTGAFWTNLVVSMGEELSFPIAVYPFAYRWSSSSLQVSYPAGNRMVEEKRIQDPFLPELTLSTKEEITKRHVVDYDPLSVTLKYFSSSSTDASWETALVQGNPYVTISYTKQTPILKPLSIFSDVQCPGDDDDKVIDLLNENGSDAGREFFGVCRIDVRGNSMGCSI